MELVLLFIELKKVALRGLRFAAGLIMPLAILNLSLGATIMLATPPGFETSLITGNGQEIELVHMQMFGGLIHLHDGPGANHYANRPLPPGVTEQEYLPTTPGVSPDWSVVVNGKNSAANFWQDLTVRGQTASVVVPHYY